MCGVMAFGAFARGTMENNMEDMQNQKYKPFILGILLFVSTALGLYCQVYLKTEIVYTHFFYIIIICAGLWYHKKVFFVALFLGIFHIVSQYAVTEGFALSTFIRAAMFIVIALTVGILSEERDKTVHMLRNEKQKFNTLSEYAPFGMMMIQKDGVISYVNGKFRELLGYDVSEIPDGKTWFRKAYPDAEYRHDVIAAWSSDLATIKIGEKSPRIFTVTCKDGAARAINFIPVALETGENIIACEDITQRRAMEESLKSSLREKEVLLKEIHHRVKNNLQIISSLLGMQSSYTDDPKALSAFRESQNRIKSIALIHNKLYGSKDLAHIDFHEYAYNLVQDIFSSYGVDPGIIAFEVKAQDIFFDINTAIPCGLLVNELVSNSLKHAFPEGRRGQITISLREKQGQGSGVRGQENLAPCPLPPAPPLLILTVSDNGIGFPGNMNVQNTETFGLRLVHGLVEQLEGTVEIKNNGGTESIIGFKEIR
jgi:PAS domain S-box-containing protein